jgi:glycosyltransferase involved in cell wall biosynthesis
MPKEVKVLHVINGLHVGGAETALLRLLEYENKSELKSGVFSLLGDGKIGEQMRAKGIATFNCQTPTTFVKSLLPLLRYCRTERPDILQGWMYHSNLVVTLVAKLAKIPVHGWNIRHSVENLRAEKPLTAKLIQISAKLSHKPDWIIFNSRRSAEQHQRLGYSPDQSVLIPNGFDTDIYKPNEALRASFRSQNQLSREDLVVGIVGRYHPHKDIPGFVRAAGIVGKSIPQARFVLIGRNMDPTNEELQQLIVSTGIGSKFRLLGEQRNAGLLIAAFDVNVSSSIGEGFPNGLAEGMSCGVPTVCTDVFDSDWLIGDTGFVVPPSNPEKLAEAIGTVLRLSSTERIKLGIAARKRIEQMFSMDMSVGLYEKLYRSRS